MKLYVLFQAVITMTILVIYFSAVTEGQRSDINDWSEMLHKVKRCLSNEDCRPENDQTRYLYSCAPNRRCFRCLGYPDDSHCPPPPTPELSQQEKDAIIPDYETFLKLYPEFLVDTDNAGV